MSSEFKAFTKVAIGVRLRPSKWEKPKLPMRNVLPNLHTTEHLSHARHLQHSKVYPYKPLRWSPEKNIPIFWERARLRIENARASYLLGTEDKIYPPFNSHKSLSKLA